MTGRCGLGLAVGAVVSAVLVAFVVLLLANLSYLSYAFTVDRLARPLLPWLSTMNGSDAERKAQPVSKTHLGISSGCFVKLSWRRSAKAQAVRLGWPP